jgi:NAD(P)H dehydrogenase (quinone)
MSRIVISGASGNLGRYVTDLLLENDNGPELTLVTRTPSKLLHRECEKVSVRYGDFTDPASLDAAYAGGETLLLISSLNVGRRLEEHRNAITAAKQAGIKYIVYTSFQGVHPKNPSLASQDHYQTERLLRESGIEHVVLRDSLYAEIFTNVVIAAAVPVAEFQMAAGDGIIAPVSKRDVAHCAVKCVLNPEYHAGAVYELTGPELLNLHDLARIGSEFHDTPIKYVPVTPQERLALLDALGFPRTYSPEMDKNPAGAMWASDEMLAGDIALAQGFHAILSHHVKFLTGREPESLWSVFERCKGKRYDEL